MAHAPITMRQNIRVQAGQTFTSRFARPMSQSEIERLQSWQDHHNYDDGRTYEGTIVDTFGPVK